VIIKGIIAKGAIIRGVTAGGVIIRGTIIKGVCRAITKWATVKETTKKGAYRVIIKGLTALRSIIKATKLFKLVFRYKIVPGGIILVIIFIEFIISLLIT